MAALTTTAMIGLGIAGGSQIAGGIIQGKAANKAAKQQMEGADRASAMRSTIYGNQMRGMEPYARFGEQNVNTLGRLLNPGVPYTPDMQARDTTAFQNRPPQSWIDPWSGQGGPGGGPQPPSRPAPPGGGMPASTAGGGGPVPWMPFAGSPGPSNRMQPRPPMMPPQQGGAPPMQPPGGMPMQLPNMGGTGGFAPPMNPGGGLGGGSYLSPEMQAMMQSRRRPTDLGSLYGRGVV